MSPGSKLSTSTPPKQTEVPAYDIAEQCRPVRVPGAPMGKPMYHPFPVKVQQKYVPEQHRTSPQIANTKSSRQDHQEEEEAAVLRPGNPPLAHCSEIPPPLSTPPQQSARRKA